MSTPTGPGDTPEWIQTLQAMEPLARRRLAARCAITDQTLRNWMHETHKPHPGALERLKIELRRIAK